MGKRAALYPLTTARAVKGPGARERFVQRIVGD
jgi:hypothetical protein